MKSRLPTEASQILYADHVEGRGIELFRKVCELDLEGHLPLRDDTLEVQFADPLEELYPGPVHVFSVEDLRLLLPPAPPHVAKTSTLHIRLPRRL